MAEKTFYYEFTERKGGFGPGVYTNVDRRMHYRMYDCATRVWRQGARGGVKLVREDWLISKSYRGKYVTKDEEVMKQFMWVKLKAQSYIKGA